MTWLELARIQAMRKGTGVNPSLFSRVSCLEVIGLESREVRGDGRGLTTVVAKGLHRSAVIRGNQHEFVRTDWQALDGQVAVRVDRADLVAVDEDPCAGDVAAHDQRAFPSDLLQVSLHGRGLPGLDVDNLLEVLEAVQCDAHRVLTSGDNAAGVAATDQHTIKGDARAFGSEDLQRAVDLLLLQAGVDSSRLTVLDVDGLLEVLVTGSADAQRVLTSGQDAACVTATDQHAINGDIRTVRADVDFQRAIDRDGPKVGVDRDGLTALHADGLLEVLEATQ